VSTGTPSPVSLAKNEVTLAFADLVEVAFIIADLVKDMKRG
jgi:hypothetical protein